MEAWSYRNDSFVWWLVVEISQGSVDWRPMMINLCSIIPLDQTDAIDRNEMMRWCDEPVDASCFCTIVIAKYAFSCWVERTWVNALKKACLSVVNGDLSIDGWWNCKRTLIVGAWINQRAPVVLWLLLLQIVEREDTVRFVWCTCCEKKPRLNNARN